MYSPKIREDLIPRIYQEAKKQGVPMTAWVSQALEQALQQSAPVELHDHHLGKEKSRDEY